MDINLAIVGGCFTVQNNIAPENLYHQIIKREIEKNSDASLRINIIRYERFAKCFEKIKNLCDGKKIDVLIFHLRTEQFLRIAKLVYTYGEKNNQRKYALTLPFFNHVSPEEKELLLLSMPAPTENSERQRGFRKFKIYLNYIAGTIAGNRRYALKKYDDLVSQITDYCKEKKINLIIAGPASRPHLKLEDDLVQDLNAYFERKMTGLNIPYVKLIGRKNETGESLFFKNGIHVSDAGHKRAANKLLQQIIELSTLV